MPAGGELLLLAEQLPADRHIVGIDLAKGMIDIASKRLSGSFLRYEKMFIRCNFLLASNEHELNESLMSLRGHQTPVMPLRSDRVSARVGDACQIPQDLQPVAGIFSCFGLQQMPEPKQVLIPSSEQTSSCHALALSN